MSGLSRIPGFPSPEREDSLKFYVLNSLPYSARMIIYLLLVAFGFLIQYITMNPWPGAFLLICATILGFVRGFDGHDRIKGFKTDKNWTTVDMDRIHEIRNLDYAITKWDRDVFDISNASGALVFVFFMAVLFVLSLIMFTIPGCFRVGMILITDSAVLVLPVWFSGIRRVFKQRKLMIKIDIIQDMEKYFATVRKEGEHFKPALLLARNRKGECMPKDARFTVFFDGMPADFYGVQAQININEVQGGYYPYFYCVIPAKTGFGLREFLNRIQKGKNIVVEFQEDGQAEVIVIRQYTTKTSGYHTDTKSCKNILVTALAAARIILEAKRNGL